MRLKNIGWIMICFLLFNVNSCTDPEEQVANEKLLWAKKLIRDSDYDRAKESLDSIESEFAEQYAILNESRALNDMITLSINEARYAELLTDLEKISGSLEDLKKNFNYSPGAANRPGKYEFKRQTAYNSSQRAFLKVNLNDAGEFYLSSNFFGNDWLSHTYVRVYDGDLSAESDPVQLSDPGNIKFEDEGNKWEVVSYKNGRDKEIIDFIYQYSERRLKVRFSGKKHHYIIMETFDKQAVKEAYELAAILKNINSLKTEMREKEEVIKRIKK
jgi:hypothetical protein